MSAKAPAESDPDGWLEVTLASLSNWGLMLDSDPKFPSWPSLVVGRPMRGSWWADPQVRLIHESGSRLVNHPDVLHVVLVSGKRTCVHRRLWPAFLAVALSDEDWKFEGLSRSARTLWDHLPEQLQLYADEPNLPSTSVRENGRLIRDLEARLLCAGSNVHTPRGSHAKVAMSWETWMAERNLSRPALPAGDGMRELDQCVDRLNREFDAHGKLPWWRSTRRS